MKRTVFVLIGLFLMSFPFVSCEDKLNDDDKKNSGEGIEGEDSYKTVQDSAFYFSNGKLQRANYSYFDSKGNQIGSLALQYDTEGNLIVNEERTMTYSDEDGNNTVVFVNNNGLSENQKVENTYSGSGRNYTRSTKRYIYHNGEWLLMSDDNEQSDNFKRVISRVQYALYNEEEIVVSRQKSISKYSVLTDNIIESESDVYSASCSYDSNNRFIITSILGKSWAKITQKNDAYGRELEYVIFESQDSIVWNETRRNEYKYDSQGLILEARSNSQKNSYTYNSSNKPLKDEYLVWSEIEGIYVVNITTDYVYSAAGVLSNVEINAESNSIELPVMPQYVRSSSGSDLSVVGMTFGMSTTVSINSYNTLGSKCSIICDSKGNPSNEILYRLDSEGNLKEFGRCKLEYDSNGNCLDYVVEILEDGTWNEVKKEQYTYDIRGNILTHDNISYSKRVIGFDPYAYVTTTENKLKAERRYNELGYIIFSSQSITSSSHTVYSDGRELNSISESEQEIYYSTIKVK